MTRQLRPAPPNARASLDQAMTALRLARELARQETEKAHASNRDGTNRAALHFTNAAAWRARAERLDRRLTGQPAQAAESDTYLDRFPAHVRAFAERAYNDRFVDGATSEREAGE